MGNVGVVNPGGVQFMSAGTGITHSEDAHSQERSVHFLQMWIIPGKLHTKPSYGQAEFADDERFNKWLRVASGRSGKAAPVELTQNAELLVSRLEDFGLPYAFEPGRLGLIFVPHGEMHIGDESRDLATIHGGDAVRIDGVASIDIVGSGLVLLWDLPQLEGTYEG